MISNVAVSNNGSYVMASGYNTSAGQGVVYFFNDRGKLLWNLTSNDYFYGSAISANGSVIVLQYLESVSYISVDGKVLWNYSFPEAITNFAISADSSHLAVGYFNAPSPNGTGGGSELCYLNSKGESLWNHTITDQGEIGFVSISSNGSYVATGTLGRIVYFFAGNGTLLWSLLTFNANQQGMISADASYLLIGESYGSLLYDFRGNLLLNDTQQPPSAISRDGSLILLSGVSYYNSQVQPIELIENNSGTRTIYVLASLNITGLSVLSVFPESNAEWVAGSGTIGPGAGECSTLSFYNLSIVEAAVALC